ncbi:hypothetical protein EHI44_16770 [Rhizobium leguminosarum]|uniref:hypothetical protein n=1 Tax=Rhizobium leguminosarum TaxID=384 RepID=UPI000FF1ECB6|nr:hypothetical protein [Rhizobium leguminosarum]RWY85168.1 hypothetical protein EHI44_16770 [Rhizobium leguminosarum]
MLNDAIIAANVANRISDLRLLVPLDARDAQIRASTVWLRDIYEHLERMWAAIGLPNLPTVRSMGIEWDNPIQDSAAYVWGRFDIDSRGSLGNRGISYDWNFGTNDPNPPDWLLGGDPFIDRERTVDEFFRSNIAFYQGEMISRLDVLEYGAYRRGFIHSEGDRYLRRSGHKAAAIDQAFATVNTEVLIFTIAQELLLSPSLTEFENAVKQGDALQRLATA